MPTAVQAMCNRYSLTKLCLGMLSITTSHKLNSLCCIISTYGMSMEISTRDSIQTLHTCIYLLSTGDKVTLLDKKVLRVVSSGCVYHYSTCLKYKLWDNNWVQVFCSCFMTAKLLYWTILNFCFHFVFFLLWILSFQYPLTLG